MARIPDSTAGTDGFSNMEYYKGTDGNYYYITHTSKGKVWRSNGTIEPAGFDVSAKVGVDAPASPQGTAAAVAQEAETSLKPLTTGLNDPVKAADLTKSSNDLAGSSLRYPLDIGDSNKNHFAVFDFYDYSPPFSAENQSLSGDSSFSLSAYNTSAENLKPAAYPQIILYMPEGIAASYRTNWDGKAFGNVVASIMRSAGKVASGDYMDAIKKAGEGIGQQLATAPGKIGADLTSSLAKRISGDSISQQDIFSSIGGVILNPNVELIFGGHDLRTLQLTFKMVPYNKDEAIAVDQIVKTFKKVMLPKFTGTTKMSSFWKDEAKSGNGYIGNPNLCKISFFKGTARNDAITQFKTCAITDFDVNYTPDGVAAFGPDGYPVATQISLSFMETKLVYAEDIDSGY